MFQNDVLKQKPVLVFIGGTLGSGKSYIAQKYFPEIPHIDPDRYMEELSGGDGRWDPKMGGKARVLVQRNFKKFVTEGTSFVKQGVSASINAILMQNEIARKAGFRTIFMYVDTDLETAKDRANERYISGERKNEIPHYKIEKKLKESREVYKEICKSPGLFDHIVCIKN